ncbi:MAG: twin-arginine translocation signal domain-containing protein, partial [Ewingella sp.]|nr:twin-arginine translocation signal domain-containing protein [Ewingella sp.]
MSIKKQGKSSTGEGLSRRTLMKSSALVGLAAAAGGISLPFRQARADQSPATATAQNEKVVWSACTVNCGSRCPLRMHVVDGEIRYVETDNTGD